MARLAHTAIKHIPKSASKDTRAPNLADGGLQLQTYQEDVHTPGARWTRYHALEQKTRSASDSQRLEGLYPAPSSCMRKLQTLCMSGMR